MRRPFKEWVQLLVWKLIFSPGCQWLHTQRFFSVANCLSGSRSQKRNSSTVTYSDPTYCDKVCFGVIEKFLTIDNKECETLHVASTNVDSCRIFQKTYKHLLTCDYVSVTGHQMLWEYRNDVLWCVHFHIFYTICFVERKRHQLMHVLMRISVIARHPIVLYNYSPASHGISGLEAVVIRYYLCTVGSRYNRMTSSI